ncbi:BA14K family protein [Mesorhizobium sp. KR9-304]|uniref:BA14K family protein n=1 Tax=Mesorhizobium sp. KR9-304 TaxID=3156614 RepID=UPI0032B5F7B1
MSLRTKLVSSLLSLTVVAGAMAGTVGQSEAKKLSKGEVAAIAGIGGFVLGLGIANAGHGPEYYDIHSSPWETHVDRCYARYRTYNHRTDTYIGYDGYEHRCTL